MESRNTMRTGFAASWDNILSGLNYTKEVNVNNGIEALFRAA